MNQNQNEKMNKNKIVLHIPHSSAFGITDERSGWTANQFFINEAVRTLTDWHTDLLFRTAKDYDASVVFPFSRFCVDVERLVGDPLEAEGQGILYTEYDGYGRELSDSDKAFWMDKYESHMQQLRDALCEDAILLDCHSFSPSSASDADICLGHNDDWSFDPEVLDIACQTFQESGYSVSFNQPYSGSLTPECPFRYRSMMIEVNKKVYMDEASLMLNSNPRQWMRWAGCLGRLYQRLAEASKLPDFQN